MLNSDPRDAKVPAWLWIVIGLLGCGLMLLVGRGSLSQQTPDAPPEPADTLTIKTAAPIWIAWGGATGPVAEYLLVVLMDDGRIEGTIVSGEDSVEIPITPGERFSAVVRACRAGGVCDGPWSEPSGWIRFCPLASDVNCDGEVGAQDFVQLSRDWGQRWDPTGGGR